MAETVVDSKGLTVTIEGLEAVKSGLRRVEAKIIADIAKGLNDVGLLVQREARRRAPYREGNLERSIDYKVEEGGVRILVPINSPAGQYAKQKHDGIYQRGPGTVAKGQEAGRLFITRAIDDNRAKIISLLKPKAVSI